LQVFGIGGVICLVLGAFLLFGGFFSAPDIPEPSFRVSWWLISIVAGIAALPVLFFIYLARSTGYVSSVETALVGRTGVAISDLAPSGSIRVANEQWTATTDLGDLIKEGEEVTVLGVYGDVLKVSGRQSGGKVRRRFIFNRLFGKREESQ